MTLRLPFIAFSLAVALLAHAGCNTFERRAQQKADVFATLSPEARERLEKKVIHVGDTADMVYIALGSPDERRESTSADAQTTTWIYNRYWQEYRGEAHAGFARHVVTNPKTGATAVYFEPVTRPVYAQLEQPVMRISFVNGRVTVIEQVNDR